MQPPNQKPKQGFMRTLWTDWIVMFTRFFGECLHRALFNKKWIAVVNVVSLPTGMIAAWLIYVHPEWSNANQALANVIFILMIPVALALLFAVIRLLFSPFLVYKAETQKLEAAQSKLAVLEARTPDFQIVSEKSGIQTWIGWNPQLRSHIASVWGNMTFINRGEGTAHNVEATFYYCWLANPSRIEPQNGSS